MRDIQTINPPKKILRRDSLVPYPVKSFITGNLVERHNPRVFLCFRTRSRTQIHFGKETGIADVVQSHSSQ